MSLLNRNQHGPRGLRSARPGRVCVCVALRLQRYERARRVAAAGKKFAAYMDYCNLYDLLKELLYYQAPRETRSSGERS